MMVAIIFQITTVDWLLNSKKMDMSLIAGMPEVIAYIRSQDESIKSLKEEHQKFDEIWKTEGITEQDIIDMKRQISNQCDLIKKLKEENDDAVEKCCTDAVEEVVKGMKSVIEEVKEENQKLKEENEKIPHLKVISSHTFQEMDHFKQKAIELMAENETLKAFKSEVIDAMKCDDDLDDDDIIRSISGMEEDIVGECELQEQIEELKEQLKINQQTVIPENIKGDWMNIWDCLLEEEENCYNQEGHDIEAETSELEDGYTYTSMRRINEWINQN